MAVVSLDCADSYLIFTSGTLKCSCTVSADRLSVRGKQGESVSALEPPGHAPLAAVPRLDGRYLGLDRSGAARCQPRLWAPGGRERRQARGQAAKGVRGSSRPKAWRSSGHARSGAGRARLRLCPLPCAIGVSLLPRQTVQAAVGRRVLDCAGGRVQDEPASMRSQAVQSAASSVTAARVQGPGPEHSARKNLLDMHMTHRTAAAATAERPGDPRRCRQIGRAS